MNQVELSRTVATITTIFYSSGKIEKQFSNMWTEDAELLAAAYEESTDFIPDSPISATADGYCKFNLVKLAEEEKPIYFHGTIAAYTTKLLELSNEGYESLNPEITTSCGKSYVSTTFIRKEYKDSYLERSVL